MATTSMPKSIPTPKKRMRGLTMTISSISHARTPLVIGCFYGILFVLLLAVLYPSESKLNLGSYMSSGVMAGMMGAHLTNFSSFTAFLGLYIYSSFYGLLFGGIVAWIAGSAVPTNIENGTLDLALSRPISRTRYYLECWLAALICSVIIGLAVVFTAWLDTLILKNTDINWQWVWITQLVQWVFLFFATGLGMLFSSFMNASRAAGGAAVGLIVLGYLINTFGVMSDKFQWLLKISPFYYAPALDVLVFHRLTWWHPWVLVIVGLVCGIAGLVVFNKRDLPVT